jgi:predicted DNA-binding protein
MQWWRCPNDEGVAAAGIGCGWDGGLLLRPYGNAVAMIGNGVETRRWGVCINIIDMLPCSQRKDAVCKLLNRSTTMTTLTLDLPPEIYERLRIVANQAGRPAADVAVAHLKEWLVSEKNERERARDVLRAAGLLAEPSAEMLAEAAQATATLEEVSAALSRPGGRLLSEIIIEQRGPKS